MKIAEQSELDTFLEARPDVRMLELLMPDINGILRCKRIHRREFEDLYQGRVKAPLTVPLLGITGQFYNAELDASLVAGDPDQLLVPVSHSLAPIPWLDSPTAQVLTGFADSDLQPSWPDPRNVLSRVVARLAGEGIHPVVATELEFYLLADRDAPVPAPLQGKITGIGRKQSGIQYCMPDDLYDCDGFLDDVRIACELQAVPLTTIHSEFSGGQWEINTHHSADPVLACDHAMLLKRIIKGVARKHDLGATFMAKPFDASAGSGLHIHASFYDEDGGNLFAGSGSAPDSVSDELRHAVAGLVSTADEAMAILAPNANSYRRFKAGAFAPSTPNWGFDHREVALRIPLSTPDNRRIEHRIAGADANPYLVAAAVLAGMHHGLRNRLVAGNPVPAGSDLSHAKVTLPRRWDRALDLFRNGSVLPDYLGETFCRAFAAVRQGECDDFHGRVTNLDYEFYLRSI